MALLRCRLALRKTTLVLARSKEFFFLRTMISRMKDEAIKVSLSIALDFPVRKHGGAARDRGTDAPGVFKPDDH